MYFLISSFAFFPIVLHISAYNIRWLSSPFSTISRHFVIRPRVGDDILDSSRLLIALATLDVICWIMSVMVSLMVSMSSISCSVSKRFHNSSWNSIFLVPICAVSILSDLFVINWFLSTSTSSFDVAHNHSVVTSNIDLVNNCYVCDDIWPIFLDVDIFGLRYTILAFPCPSPPCFLLKYGIHDFERS